MDKLQKYINENCIYRATDKKLPAKGGGQYSWQFYMGRMMHNYDMLNHAATRFWNIFMKKFLMEEFQIAAIQNAATPLLYPIANYAHKPINFFSIRKEAKPYGLMNWTEGIPNDKPVLVIDDLANSGHSLMKSYQILTHLGLPVYDYCFAIVNKAGGIRQDWLPKGKKWECISLFNLDDFDLMYYEYDGPVKFTKQL